MGLFQLKVSGRLWLYSGGVNTPLFQTRGELRLLMWTVGHVLVVNRHSEKTRDREGYGLVRYTAIL